MFHTFSLIIHYSSWLSYLYLECFRYLDLLKAKPLYPFLLDKDENVISFPPITNCEATKVLINPCLWDKDFPGCAWQSQIFDNKNIFRLKIWWYQSQLIYWQTISFYFLHCHYDSSASHFVISNVEENLLECWQCWSIIPCQRENSFLFFLGSLALFWPGGSKLWTTLSIFDWLQISDSTTDILLEVSSSKSLLKCKQVMEELVKETLTLAIGSSQTDDEDGVASNGNHLIVEQVRVTDINSGNLRVVYPSRVDLVDIPIHVDRD